MVVVVPPHLPNMAECSSLPCNCHVVGGGFGSPVEADFGSGLASLHLRRLVCASWRKLDEGKAQGLVASLWCKV